MITKNLYDEILIDPANNGSNELFIVSGYSSATFLSRHINELKKINTESKINLLVGMHQRRNDHSAYLNIKRTFGDCFHGYYYTGNPGVHSKTYSWIKNGSPRVGFSGSANYSQYGFFNTMQQNQMLRDDPSTIRDYFEELISDSIKIEDYLPPEAEDTNFKHLEGSLLPGEIEWVVDNKSVRISLLSKDGTLSEKGGLNWGQRPGREPNQAYLSIRASARKEGFLPEEKFTFSLITDDNKAMDCTVQQASRKAISTTNDNSLLGKYFRERLNVAVGSLVTKENLMAYGRTDFLLKKLDDETFFLDFRKPDITKTN
jgi:hypothetical protein